MDKTSEGLPVRIGETGYPQLLKQIQLPPEIIFTLGSFTKRDAFSVAIVGSRAPTPYGIWAARRLAGDLGEAGITVISGMARGIDTAAHEAALEAGGRTIAVLGCGIDVVYPRRNTRLRARIADSGVVVTEFGKGTQPLPRNFPQRNRIISGLSLAVVVVEAAMKSGSLITARWALDQGREVMAVPGRIDNRLSDGPNHLISEGAQPVCCTQDILDTLGVEKAGTDKERKDPDIPLIIRELKKRSMRVEELANKLGMKVETLSAEMGRLELLGKVGRGPGGYYFISGKGA